MRRGGGEAAAARDVGRTAVVGPGWTLPFVEKIDFQEMGEESESTYFSTARFRLHCGRLAIACAYNVTAK